jgi:hypothetical protein
MEKLDEDKPTTASNVTSLDEERNGRKTFRS